MPRNKQGGMRKKRRVHTVKENPFPIPLSSTPGEPAGTWFYYTGYIEGSAVVVKHSGDMDFLYKMGFFGKGTLSRSQPSFHERSHKVQIELPKKDGQHKSVQAVVVNKRSFLVHQRYKALAEGRTKMYSDIVQHEDQQQGFVDSSSEEEEEDEEDSSDDSESDTDVDSEKTEAFKLLNIQNSITTNPGQENVNSSAVENIDVNGRRYISGKVRSHLVSILAEISVLSNEQITTFLRVPQSMKQLAEKYKNMRAVELSMFRQMFAAQFPGRNFKKGEVITLDEDDSLNGSKHFENETDNAVVISDSDDADENKKNDKGIAQLKNIDDGGGGTVFLSLVDDVDENAMKEKRGDAGDSSKRDTADWESDDSNFWGEESHTPANDKNDAKQATLEHKNAVGNVPDTLQLDKSEDETVKSKTEHEPPVPIDEGVADGTRKEEMDGVDVEKKETDLKISTPAVAEVVLTESTPSAVDALITDTVPSAVDAVKSDSTSSDVEAVLDGSTPSDEKTVLSGSASHVVESLLDDSVPRADERVLGDSTSGAVEALLDDSTSSAIKAVPVDSTSSAGKAVLSDSSAIEAVLNNSTPSTGEAVPSDSSATEKVQIDSTPSAAEAVMSNSTPDMIESVPSDSTPSDIEASSSDTAPIATEALLTDPTPTVLETVQGDATSSAVDLVHKDDQVNMIHHCSNGSKGKEDDTDPAEENRHGFDNSLVKSDSKRNLDIDVQNKDVRLSVDDKPVVKDVGGSDSGDSEDSKVQKSPAEENAMDTAQDDHLQVLKSSSDNHQEYSLNSVKFSLGISSKGKEGPSSNSKTLHELNDPVSLSGHLMATEPSHSSREILSAACEASDGVDCSTASEIPKPDGLGCSTASEIAKPDGLGCSTASETVKPDGVHCSTASETVKPDGVDCSTASETFKPDGVDCSTASETVRPDGVDCSTASETVRPDCVDCTTPSETVRPDELNCEDFGIILKGQALQTLAKGENDNCKTVSQKSDSPNLSVDMPKENVSAATQSGASRDNKSTFLLNSDVTVTQIESENSNDSDDVICIESESAEPKKLHNFLSQSAKKGAVPVVTKSVTFMSSLTEEPAFVKASVGFHCWSSVLHFNFTGDSSHLPTVMSVSSNFSSASERLSQTSQLQDSEDVYERIYPPIKSLIPNSSSTGALIKQRLRGLPFLTTAYLNISKPKDNSLASSSNGSTPRKQTLKELQMTHLSQARFKPYSVGVSPASNPSDAKRIINSSGGVMQSHPASLPKNMQPCPLSTLSSQSSYGSSTPPELKFSHVCSLLKAYQSSQKSHQTSDRSAQNSEKSAISDQGSAEMLYTDNKKIGHPCSPSTLLVTLSPLVAGIEKLYHFEFSKDKLEQVEDQEKHKAERDTLISEFHEAVSQYLSSVEISTVMEFHILTLLLLKSGIQSNISQEDLSQTRSNLSDFQTWLLGRRLEYVENSQRLQNLQDGNKLVIVDLTEKSISESDITANPLNKLKVSHPQRNTESEVIVDLTVNSGQKVNNSHADIISDGEMKVDLKENSGINILNLDDNFLEETAAKESTLENSLTSSRKTLQNENRKRRFDRLGEMSDNSGKKLKSDEDGLLMLKETNDREMITDEDEILMLNQIGDEKMISYRSEYQVQSKDENIMVVQDGCLTQMEEESQSNMDAMTSAKNIISNEIKPDILSTESCTVENLHVKVSTSCDLQSEKASLNSGTSQPQMSDDICKSDINVSKFCDAERISSEESIGSLEVIKDVSGVDKKELTVTEEVQDLELIQSSSSSDILIPSQKSSRSVDDMHNTEDGLLVTQIQPSALKHDVACSKTCEDKNSDVVLISSSEQQNSSKTTNNLSDNMSSSSSPTTGKATEKLLDRSEGSVKKPFMKEGTQKPDVILSCPDNSGSDLESVSCIELIPESTIFKHNKDINPRKDDTFLFTTVSDNVQKNDTVGKERLRNAGSSRDVQIFIGSSSDEADEPVRKRHKSHQSGSVHPYSLLDESDGDLFVVANTSDEDFNEDSDDERGKRGNRKKQLLWRPCVKRNPYHTEERLHLMLEEAFFLSFGLGCLKILDPEMKVLDLTQMWQQFQVLKETFVPHYVAYHYFRSKGWVPKSGLKFGCDFILYKDGPPFYHGSYSVVVTVVKNTTLLPFNRNGGAKFGQRKLNWVSLAGLNRITEHVAKELMMCYVIWPGDLTHEQSLLPDCISRFKVKEVVVSRWVSSQERENKLGDEDMP